MFTDEIMRIKSIRYTPDDVADSLGIETKPHKTIEDYLNDAEKSYIPTNPPFYT